MTNEKLKQKVKELEVENKNLKEKDKSQALENEINRLGSLLHETLTAYGNLLKTQQSTTETHINLHTNIVNKLKK